MMYLYAGNSEVVWQKTANRGPIGKMFLAWRLSSKFLKVSMIFLSLFGCLVLWLSESPSDKQNRSLETFAKQSTFFQERSPLNTKCTRQLQLWSHHQLYLYSSEPYRFSCPGIPCEAQVVADTSLATTRVSDAVLLFPKTNWSWEEMHKARPRVQKWIFYSRESPARTKRSIIPPPKYYNISYDYIMTFRRGYDFSAEYGTYDPTRPEVPADDQRNWAQNKTGLVIWVASNCHDTSWKRRKFVNQLKSLIAVDTYGDCGDDGACPAGDECEAKLTAHKFYLALENSRCRDYITEKFYKNLVRGTVPIVYGPPREDYERVGPPNSFIHVDDFPTVEDLAEYLTLLDKNDTMYNQYFEWKKMGSVVDVWNRGSLFKPEVLCQVFQRMHQDEMKEGVGNLTRRAMPDWDKWWLGSCEELLRT